MFKFWLALILGTIAISAGLTYLKLHRGAQTISYPAPAPKTKPPALEFHPLKADTEEVQMEISANVVTFKVKDFKIDKPNEVAFKINNQGEGQLELSLQSLTSPIADTSIFVDQQKVTLTDHKVKVPPGKTVVVQMIYQPKYEIEKAVGKTPKITATFEHNDVRYSDFLHFEIDMIPKR